MPLFPLRGSLAGVLLCLWVGCTLPGRAQAPPDRAVWGPGRGSGTTTAIAPTISIGPDDKSYIVSAANSGVLATLAAPAGLPEYLLTLDAGVLAGGGAPRWGGRATLSYLRIGLDVSAGGISSADSARAFGLRYDLDPGQSRRRLIAEIQRAFRAERAEARALSPGIVKGVREALDAENRSIRLIASTDYADLDAAGNAWSASLAICKLVRLGRSGGLRLSATPQFVHLRRAPDSDDVFTGTVLMAYDDRYPELAEDGRTFLHWRSEVGIHFTPRSRVSDAAVAGVYASLWLGPNLGAEGGADQNWRALVRGATLLTLGVGVGADRRAYYGLSLSRSFP